MEQAEYLVALVPSFVEFETRTLASFASASSLSSRIWTLVTQKQYVGQVRGDGRCGSSRGECDCPAPPFAYAFHVGQYVRVCGCYQVREEYWSDVQRGQPRVTVGVHLYSKNDSER